MGEEKAASASASGSLQDTAVNAHAVSEKYDSYEVVLEPSDDPVSLPLWRRWLAALVVCGGAICVTGASSMVCLRFCSCFVSNV